jgi:hypothetical protein
MVCVKMDDARLTTYMKLVFPDPAKLDDERAIERVWKNRQQASVLFVNGKGNRLKSVAGTLWAAYNGVAELVDHGSTKRTAAQQLKYIWYGSGAGTKARAFEVAKKQMAAGWAR